MITILLSFQGLFRSSDPETGVNEHHGFHPGQWVMMKGNREESCTVDQGSLTLGDLKVLLSFCTLHFSRTGTSEELHPYP